MDYWNDDHEKPSIALDQREGGGIGASGMKASTGVLGGSPARCKSKVLEGEVMMRR